MTEIEVAACKCFEQMSREVPLKSTDGERILPTGADSEGRKRSKRSIPVDGRVTKRASDIVRELALVVAEQKTKQL